MEWRSRTRRTPPPPPGTASTEDGEEDSSSRAKNNNRRWCQCCHLPYRQRNGPRFFFFFHDAKAEQLCKKKRGWTIVTVTFGNTASQHYFLRARKCKLQIVTVAVAGCCWLLLLLQPLILKTISTVLINFGFFFPFPLRDQPWKSAGGVVAEGQGHRIWAQ